MTVQVLVATMNQIDHSLLHKMNIQSSAIVGNQCLINEIEKFKYRGNQIKYLSFNEKGVGLNRNNALMRADKEICLLADDDMVFKDNYTSIVESYFKKYSDVDVIIFNIVENPPKRTINKRVKRIRTHNFMKYGAARIAFRRERVTMNGIFFNLHFGGGAEYSAGEDVLFLKACLEKKLKIIAVPDSIAELHDVRESTWFKGYNESFFHDKGVLYATISKRWAFFLSLRFAIKHKKRFVNEISMKHALSAMIKGAKTVR